MFSSGGVPLSLLYIVGTMLVVMHLVRLRNKGYRQRHWELATVNVIIGVLCLWLAITATRFIT